MPANRLSKVLAAAGVASRRACEELIASGRVTVNGAPTLLPQHPVDPEVDHVKIDGKRLSQNPNKYYFVLNKPKGFICTQERPKVGRIVGDLFPKGLPRLFTVGRLDKDTTGLLIVTNDGHFGHQVIHPSSCITKEYLVKVREELDAEALESLRAGAIVDGVFVRPVSVVRTRRGTARVTVSEGRKHEVRILVEKARLTLVSLERIRLGSIVLGDLPLGAFRPLTNAERKALLEAAAVGRAKPKRRQQGVVRPRARTEKGTPTAKRDWVQEEREPMSGQENLDQMAQRDETLDAAACIQWEQVTPPQHEPSEGVTPRREKRDAFASKRGFGQKPRFERGPRPFQSRDQGPRGDFPSARGPRRSEFGGDRDGFAPRPNRFHRTEEGMESPRGERRQWAPREEFSDRPRSSDRQPAFREGGFRPRRDFGGEGRARPFGGQGRARPFGGEGRDRPFRSEGRERSFPQQGQDRGFSPDRQERRFRSEPRADGPRQGGFRSERPERSFSGENRPRPWGNREGRSDERGRSEWPRRERPAFGDRPRRDSRSDGMGAPRERGFRDQFDRSGWAPRGPRFGNRDERGPRDDRQGPSRFAGRPAERRSEWTPRQEGVEERAALKPRLWKSE